MTVLCSATTGREADGNIEIGKNKEGGFWAEIEDG